MFNLKVSIKFLFCTTELTLDNFLTFGSSLSLEAKGDFKVLFIYLFIVLNTYSELEKGSGEVWHENI